VQTLRSIDLQTRSADLDVFVYIATDKTPLLCQNLQWNPAAPPRWHRPSEEGPTAEPQSVRIRLLYSRHRC
jgi:hypothetical protein